VTEILGVLWILTIRESLTTIRFLFMYKQTV
jgi:hypothetical protein